MCVCLYVWLCMSVCVTVYMCVYICTYKCACVHAHGGQKSEAGFGFVLPCGTHGFPAGWAFCCPQVSSFLEPSGALLRFYALGNMSLWMMFTIQINGLIKNSKSWFYGETFSVWKVLIFRKSLAFFCDFFRFGFPIVFESGSGLKPTLQLRMALDGTHVLPWQVLHVVCHLGSCGVFFIILDMPKLIKVLH